MAKAGPRPSIHDAKLTDRQIEERQKLRDATAWEVWPNSKCHGINKLRLVHLLRAFALMLVPVAAFGRSLSTF
jgi:hypothetical protein